MEGRDNSRTQVIIVAEFGMSCGGDGCQKDLIFVLEYSCDEFILIYPFVSHALSYATSLLHE